MGGVALGQVPFEEAARTAALKSTLAQAGGAPFHLRATILDEKGHDPQWDAEVEEWWASPTRYKRVFHSRDFAQTLVVDGEKVSEVDEGAVFPELLRNLVVELVDPIPRVDELAALHLTVMPSDGTKGQIVTRYKIPTSDGAGVVGSMDASVAIDRATGLMVYGGNLDWDVAMHDFAEFHGLQVARRLTAQTQGGVRLTAQMTLLEDLSVGDAASIRVGKVTPVAKRLRVVVVPEVELRRLGVEMPELRWPEGSGTGVMTMRVVVDRGGLVRSVDSFFAGNKGLQGAAEEQILKWRFKPFVEGGVAVQVISTLTFAY